MTELDRNALRLLFMREGKIAGGIWHWLDEEPPQEVRTHLWVLIESAGADYARLSEDDRDSLVSVFFGMARKARTPEPPTPAQPLDCTPDAVRSRVAMVRAAAMRELHERDASWAQPSSESLAIVSSVCADPESGVSEADAAILYGEVGRLTGPLWITGEWEGMPDLALVSVRALDATIGELTNLEPRFDEARSEFRIPLREAVLETLHSGLFDSLRAARTLYLADHPSGGKLPSDPAARRDEEERRAAERAWLVQRAMAAVDMIVQPVLDAIGAFAEARAAEIASRQAADDAARALARAAAGFPRPEPQRYGVSPRGAELWVADALRWLGEHDAEVTRQSADGGVDVVSARIAVSVKHYSGAVPVEEIREIFGVAVASRRTAVLWTSGTLTEQARQFADLAPVAIVTYDVDAATWAGANDAGEAFLAGFDVGARGDEERGIRV